MVDRRQIVLALFPEQSKESDMVLSYDEEAGRYVSNALEVESTTTCTICLDSVEQNGVFGANCKHAYHHKCLMEWIMSDHDDCPTCRAPLWDEVAYIAIQASLSPSMTETSSTPSPACLSAGQQRTYDETLGGEEVGGQCAATSGKVLCIGLTILSVFVFLEPFIGT